MENTNMDIKDTFSTQQNHSLFSIDELEALYLSVYDSCEIETSSGDDVLDFLQWCRMVVKENV